MARKSINTLLSDLPTVFPDNNQGLITPAAVRAYFTDLLNAVRPSYAILRRGAGVAQALTATPSPLVFTESDLTNSLGEYAATPNIGRVTNLNAGVVRITLTADLTPPGNTDKLITFQVFVNGVASIWRQTVGTTDTGLTVSITFPSILSSETANVNYDMYVSINSPDTYTFSNMAMLVETVPRNT